MNGETLRWDVALRRRIEAAFENWGHVAYRRPWPIIFGMALLPLALAFQLPQVKVETSIEHFLDEGHPAQIAYDEFRDRYGRDEMILLGLQAPDVFDLHFLERLRSLHEAMEDEVPHLDEVTSLFNVRETRGEDDELIVGDLLEPWPETPEDRMAIRERALANPLYHNFILTPDGTFTTMVIKTSAFSDAGSDLQSLTGFDDTEDDEAKAPPAYLSGTENSEAAAAVLSVAERFQSESFSISIAGGPMMEHVLMQQLTRNIIIFMSLSLLTVALLLYVLFRRVTAVLLPLLVVLLSIVSTFGCMPLLGTKVGIPTQILPSFLLAVGVGGAVHLLTIFFQRYDAGASREEALAGALHHSGLAIAMTGLTTAGGLVSFSVAEIEPVAALGRFAPLGIGLGLSYCLVLLPALISIVPLGARRKDAHQRSRWIDRALLRTGDFSVTHPWTVILGMSVVLLISIAGIMRLEFKYDPLSWFPDDDPILLATELIDDRLEGSFTLEFIVDTDRENGLHDPELLQSLDELAAKTLAIEGEDGLRAGKTISLADIVKEIHRALNEDRPEFYAVSENPELIAQELLLFESRSLYDPAALLPALRLSELHRIRRDRIQRDASSRRPLPSHRRGHPLCPRNECNEIEHDSQLSDRAGPDHAADVSVAWQLPRRRRRHGAQPRTHHRDLGFMGWAGIPLDLFTLLIGSIAIGLAVDDTIHFMHHFRIRYDIHYDARLAVRETLQTTGRALLTTSIVLSLAFFTYTFASLTNLALFGLLTGFTVVTAFVADIGVAPALMELATRNLPRPDRHPDEAGLG